MCGRPKCSSCNVAFPHKNAPCLSCKSKIFRSNKDSKCNAEEDRNAFNNFFIDSSENDLSYFDFFHKSEYFDISSLNDTVGDQNFYLMHFNVRSIHKTLDELANLLTQLKALSDVLAITATKLKPDQVHTNINLEGYTFIHSDSEKHSGGMGFYIKKSLSYKIQKDININMAIVEDMWIKVQTATDPVVAGVCYRHPISLVEDYEQFSNKLFEIFRELNSDKRSFYALGDYLLK